MKAFKNFLGFVFLIAIFSLMNFTANSQNTGDCCGSTATPCGQIYYTVYEDCFYECYPDCRDDDQQ